LVKVILTKGLPGSGKSTWAKKILKAKPNSYKRINKDDLRAMLDDGKFSHDSEKFILEVRDALIQLAVLKGKHVIVDDTNLAPKHEARIRQLIKGTAEFQVMDFTDVPIETCIERDLQRTNSVGEKVIRQMYNQFLAPKKEEVDYVKNAEHVVICDLDNTLFLLNGRNPYDASTCVNDLLNPVVFEIIKNRRVILVSGREDKYMVETKMALDKHKINFIDLFMRETGDSRKDAIVKQEIFDSQIRFVYNVDFVLDDRNQVVEMWRSLGLTCLQVADGDF
jgi:predicted kinase